MKQGEFEEIANISSAILSATFVQVIVIHNLESTDQTKYTMLNGLACGRVILNLSVTCYNVF
jgi:hypothetical protein